MEISQAAIDLIIAWEVGGGERERARPQYDAKYTRPHWPGNSASGLTIGIGYDLRFAKSWFEADWKARLDALPARDVYRRLLSHVGKAGSNAAERATADIEIPWADAMSVFKVRRLPGFVETTESFFPGVASLNAHVRGALTSLIYNCGTGTKGKPDKRDAYLAIRRAVTARDVQGIADGIRSMKKHHAHSPKVAKGLGRRRDDEAAFVEKLGGPSSAGDGSRSAA
jgi:hypothetical protein